MNGMQGFARPARRGVPALLLIALLQGCGGPATIPGGGGGAGPDAMPPSVPAALTATAQSPARIQLTWQPSTDAGTGVAGYRVFRDGGATAVATVTTPSWLDTGLTANTTYSYTVRAFDGAAPANESGGSAAASATTPATPVPGVSGLDSRPSNTACLAGEAPSSSVSLALDQVFAGLGAFSSPVLMLQEPASTARWYVVQKTGIVFVFDNQPNATTRREFINLTTQITGSASDERGLLGMAFHPDYPTNPARVCLVHRHGQWPAGLAHRGIPDA
ncbi:MAG: fibronectin type III domain-containing protein [Proteobacteria bacterium]|nr:fibronectin type III domain-containing protein [Pseudomonadota bacterium]